MFYLLQMYPSTEWCTPMNIWSADKDSSIKHVLLLLESRFGSSGYEIDFQTKTDSKAIYLNHRDAKGMKAYLYTLTQKPEHYGVQLEFPATDSANPFFETYENLTFDALANILSVHLDLVQC